MNKLFMARNRYICFFFILIPLFIFLFNENTFNDYSERQNLNEITYQWEGNITAKKEENVWDHYKFYFEINDSEWIEVKEYHYFDFNIGEYIYAFKQYDVLLIRYTLNYQEIIWEGIITNKTILMIREHRSCYLEINGTSLKFVDQTQYSKYNIGDYVYYHQYYDLFILTKSTDSPF